MDDVTAALALKAIGSFAGALLALVFQKPKNWAEFFTRLAFSSISGMLFGENVREYMHWAETWQMWISAAALTAMLSWFVMGSLVRIISMWKPKE